jgi:dienelactone hydrolase
MGGATLASGPARDRDDVTFDVHGTRCAAWLYRPAGARAPVVILAHGLGAPRYARLDATAERLVAAGLAVLLFDHRHLGDSGGEPRQLVSVSRQLDDWRAAVRHARARDDVDGSRVALFGTSFSGGHVLTIAAEDEAIAAVVAQTPFVDGRARLEFAPRGLRLARAFLAALADRAGAGLGARPWLIPICARPGALGVLTSPDALEGFRILDVRNDGRNEVAARVLLDIARYRPGLAAKRIRCPVLYYLASGDHVTPLAACRRTAAATPRAEVRTFDGGHFDVYHGEGFAAAIAAEAEFLARHLRPAR